MFIRIHEDIANIKKYDPASRSTLEILFSYPGLWAVWHHRFNHFLWRKRFKTLARFLSTLSRFITGIEIHPAAQIGRRFFIDHGMGVVIGETSEIGDDCMIYHGVTLGGTTLNKGKRHPTLGNHVIIGAGAKILGPITIGDGASVGSNSVVVKSVPSNVTAVGVPARIIKAETNNLKKEIAHRLFYAYGMRPDLEDPETEAINLLLNHIEKLDVALCEMRQTLKDQGIQLEIDWPTIQEYSYDEMGLHFTNEKNEPSP